MGVMLAHLLHFITCYGLQQVQRVHSLFELELE
jgi:hypothetical protein